MKTIVILKTSSDKVFKELLAKLALETQKKYCLIQSNIVQKYKGLYPEIEYIPIGNQGFHNVDDDIIMEFRKMEIDTIYIPITKKKAYNFSNVMRVIKHWHFNKIIFYNSETDKYILKKKSYVKQIIYFFYIKLMGVFLR